MEIKGNNISDFFSLRSIRRESEKMDEIIPITTIVIMATIVVITIAMIIMMISWFNDEIYVANFASICFLENIFYVFLNSFSLSDCKLMLDQLNK